MKKDDYVFLLLSCLCKYVNRTSLVIRDKSLTMPAAKMGNYWSEWILCSVNVPDVSSGSEKDEVMQRRSQTVERSYLIWKWAGDQTTLTKHYSVPSLRGSTGIHRSIHSLTNLIKSKPLLILIRFANFKVILDIHYI